MSEPLAPRSVSVIVPVKNGAAWIRTAIDAIWQASDGLVAEVVAVDDGGDDSSRAILDDLAAHGLVRVVDGPHRGAAAAINVGLAATTAPIVCQIDQDVIVDPGWVRAVTTPLADPTVGAVQGHYRLDRAAPLLARVMALDLEQRYARLDRATDHVCTGNTAYRRAALDAVGGFDESLGYGYDNDVSYRLRAAGHRLAHCHQATSRHRWRDSLVGYWRQQYGFGYGRLDLVARHPARIGGDAVSPTAMMLHPVLLAVAWACLLVWLGFAMAGVSLRALAILPAILGGMLVCERAWAGARAAVRFGDAAGLLFPVVHLVRDHAWLAAMVAWVGRRVSGVPMQPSHSMRPRTATLAPEGASSAHGCHRPTRWIAIVLAHNEAGSIGAVLDELRACHPHLDVLVVDDGSTDGTCAAVASCGVPCLRLDRRRGIGCAMRAGLAWADRHGYDAVVRLDGDGQHRACDVAALQQPIQAGRVDATLGSRYRAPGADTTTGSPPIARRVLAKWLSRLTGRPVTDPTSGFAAFGPRAMGLLATRHPTGYAEPEVLLLLDREGFDVEEVAVEPRARLAGRTSLTPPRIAWAAVRVFCVLLVEPWRRRVAARQVSRRPVATREVVAHAAQHRLDPAQD